MSLLNEIGVIKYEHDYKDYINNRIIPIRISGWFDLRGNVFNLLSILFARYFTYGYLGVSYGYREKRRV